MSKKYGLILSDKSKPPSFQASRNIFGNDSDSDDESAKKPVLLRPSDNIHRQAKVTQEKAILEDPTVYQYDEIYDNMVSKKQETKSKSKEEKKPRYIENLLKTANKRKIENERRVERQIQKEREKEGDEFADKEVFVTSAYKKKLEELQLEEEREKREEYLEKIGDVTKQSDLGGFYRHLYEQKLGKDTKEADRNETIKISEKSTDITKTNIKDTETSKRRNYRKRNASNHLSEGEIEDSDDEINHVNMKEINQAKKSKKTDENIDADSDFSVDDPSSDVENDVKLELIKPVTDTKKEKKQNENSKSKNEESSSKVEKKEEEERVVTPPKPKIDIWKKRTVGDVFEQALKRYYERKASRGM